MNRNEQELDILVSISQILSDGHELSEAFQRAINVLGQAIGLDRAVLTLQDPASEQLQIVASVGLSAQEQQRGKYAVGEGVSGRVYATGRAEVVPDIAKQPEFLNKTQSSDMEGHPQSFLCVPVFNGPHPVGTIGVLKPFNDADTLEADTRLITIFAGMISQTIRIYQQMRLERDQWLQEKQLLTDDLRARYRFDNIIGTSPAMVDVLGTIAQVASSRATCLILGETGCGKELIAKAIHYNSPRRDKPLIRVNCGALSAQLLESELFGHVKGAFTGAVRDKVGRFEAANGGTLFLDEVGTLSPQLQVKLLRVLQEREFERVGDHHTLKADVRIIAATNLDLEEEVRAGTFRDDLYYRLNVVSIHLPPLRSRREDVPMLIDHFLKRFNQENARSVKRISRDVMNVLLRYPWPGNVRELENAIERAVVMSTGDELGVDLLPLQVRLFAEQRRSDAADETVEALCIKLADHAIKQLQVYDGQVYDLVINEVERQLLRESLVHCNGVKLKAAKFLGINRNTLNKKVKDLAVPGG
ncbi:MAG: sigma 54-interacting transcriptional regulator [Phycisphaerales bacterium JB063]